jgi:hypothetical protein
MRNDFLYHRLRAVFGQVKIARQGTEEEEYRVCCPFCGDKDFRLYINCKWGVYDLSRRQDEQWMIHCWNENCVNPGVSRNPLTKVNRENLYYQIYHGAVGLIHLNPPTTVLEEPIGSAEWPGRVIRLDVLSERDPDHCAVTYLKRRGFDPVSLGRKQGFCFCDHVEDARYRMALGTIIMPVWKDGRLYSWLSRVPYDDVNGVPLSKTKIKKYYNCPGRSLSKVGYELDTVLQYRTVVVVEGIFDAIKTGPFATCLFTKTLSLNIKKRIVEGLSDREGTALVVMLDPDQSASEKQRGVTHPIEALASQFKDYSFPVVKVYLPSGKDPGSMTSAAILREIKQAAQEQKVSLDFRKCKRNGKNTSSQLGRTDSSGTGLLSISRNNGSTRVGDSVDETKKTRTGDSSGSRVAASTKNERNSLRNDELVSSGISDERDRGCDAAGQYLGGRPERRWSRTCRSDARQ